MRVPPEGVEPPVLLPPGAAGGVEPPDVEPPDDEPPDADEPPDDESPDVLPAIVVTPVVVVVVRVGVVDVKRVDVVVFADADTCVPNDDPPRSLRPQPRRPGVPPPYDAPDPEYELDELVRARLVPPAFAPLGVPIGGSEEREEASSPSDRAPGAPGSSLPRGVTDAGAEAVAVAATGAAVALCRSASTVPEVPSTPGGASGGERRDARGVISSMGWSGRSIGPINAGADRPPASNRRPRARAVRRFDTASLLHAADEGRNGNTAEAASARAGMQARCQHAAGLKMGGVLRFIARRLLLTVPVLLGVATLVFSLIHFIPGDPVQAMLGDAASPQDVEELRTRLGLDRPLIEQYGTFLRGVVRGDLGRSMRTNQPVTETIVERMPATFELALAAMLVAVGFAIPLGIAAAVWRGTAVDHSATTISLLGISIPNFWLGPLLALVFAVELGWLPVSGRGTWAHLVLPAISLGGALAAILARMTRATLLEELREQYVQAARARGVSRARAVLRHAFRNSLIPVVTLLGLQFGAVLTGAVITETIFSWPGIGRLLIQSIGFRDYPLVQGCILLIAVTYVGVNLLTDLVYGIIDPRIRYE